MNFKELLLDIEQLATEMDIPKVYMVGGVPRDKFAGNLKSIKDIDLTNGSPSIKDLALQIKKKFGATFREYPDGHSSLRFPNLDLDFSSNFVVPQVDKLVGKALFPLERETWSRDFTCNTLLWDLKLESIKDLTGKGKQDIKSRILRTCLEPKITLGVDSKRAARVFYLAAKLDFQIAPDLFQYMKDHPELQDAEPQDFLLEKLSTAYVKNREKTLKLLQDLGWKKLYWLVKL